MKPRNHLYRKITVLTFLFLVGTVIFFVGQEALAQQKFGLEYATVSFFGTEDIRVIIFRIIRIILGFLGIVALILILYGGFLWMTSEGNEEKVGKAKRVLRDAIIGLLIILSSLALAQFIISQLLKALGVGVAGPTGPPGGPGGFVDRLGAGIIESHYPERDARGIPRNTKIVITFKEEMLLESIIHEYFDNDTPYDTSDDSVEVIDKDGNVSTVSPAAVPSDYWMRLKAENIEIYESDESGAAVGDPLTAAEVKVRFTDDLKTFVFKPVDYLGYPDHNSFYSVALMTDILKASGEPAFGSFAGVGYSWQFGVSTVLDLTPPYVKSVIPDPGDEVHRNIVIQINFNEAVDPISASGASASFDNITVEALAAGLVNGTFAISNGYETVEFKSDDACGINSCGQTVYCLPAEETIKVTVKAAELLFGGPEGDPYTGVVDMADNSLDGNKDGVAQGPTSDSGMPPYDLNDPDSAGQGDDLQWSFSTDDEIDLTVPLIEEIKPTEEITDLKTPIEMKFSKTMSSSTLRPDTVDGKQYISLYQGEWTGPDTLSCPTNCPDVAYWIKKENIEESGVDKTWVYIKHSQFSNVVDTIYSPEASSNVQDIYQNCFYPSCYLTECYS